MNRYRWKAGVIYLVLPNMWKDVLRLSLSHWKSEWRQRYALQAIFLQVIAGVFVLQLAVSLPDARVWNGVFWILLLFNSVQASGKSFLQESRGKMLYYHFLVSPQAFILSKTLLNAVMIGAISLISLLFYGLMLGNPVDKIWIYTLIIVLSASGYAIVFTMASAIASKTQGGHILMPVLSFPLSLPMLLVAVKASSRAVNWIEGGTAIWTDIGVLALLNVAFISLAYILYPFLWKD